MKKLLFLLFFTANLIAQERSVMFTAGVDALKPTKDFVGGIALKTGRVFQIGVNFQYYPSAGYYDLELEGGTVLKYRDKWLFTPQASLKLIMRGGDMVERDINNQEFLSPKLGLNVKYRIVDGFLIGLDSGVVFRGDEWDLSERKDFSGALKLDLKVELVYEIEFE